MVRGRKTSLSLFAHLRYRLSKIAQSGRGAGMRLISYETGATYATYRYWLNPEHVLMFKRSEGRGGNVSYTLTTPTQGRT